jgi:hypothetical protein
MTRKKAIGEFNGLNICGRALLVSEARPQESRGGHNRFGGGRGRNRGGGRRGYQLRKCPWLVALKVGRGNGFFRAKACKVYGSKEKGGKLRPPAREFISKWLTEVERWKPAGP